MAPQLDPYFKQVDSLSEHFIDRLRKAVAIPSVSADDERRPDVVKVCAWLPHTIKANRKHRWASSWRLN
jgi:Cys-Gly metallodipeptidase DUG1